MEYDPPAAGSGDDSFMQAAIDIDSVTKRYGSVQALRGVSLRVEQGEFFALLGPNGAGKTTLISIIAGLARASSGSVKVMGHDVVADYRIARRQLGVVPQELVFDPFFSVRESLQISSGYYGVRNNDAWIDEILESLGLTSKAKANMRSLSGGMKRRVLVAQALVHRPPVIVLDEPTAGVDVELRQSLWAFIQRLNRDGHTIVLTTHYLEEAQALCQRVAMLKAGRIVALDHTASLLKRFAGGTLVLSLSGAPLPEPLESRVIAGPVGDTRLHLQIERYGEVEFILAALREAGCVIEEMEVAHTDLEDVFVKVMNEV
jgi:ABC-2 type transport system ATP-binding protein